ncbi:hypothetical protein P879_03811 [Paragonimus westermani]|uniref:LIM zinc-binding domain-containing protein n=1 Tax=Paragonimus westermani TaxID=34504 RepID=A0A8T0DF56_9TREM|nr:hypothetical protein P879_03811 [Paragonimus westermani]
MRLVQLKWKFIHQVYSMNGFRCETIFRQAFGWPEDDPFRRMKGYDNPFIKKPSFRNYSLSANENRFLTENLTGYENETPSPNDVTSECQMSEVPVVSSEQTLINNTSELKQSSTRNGYMDSTHTDGHCPAETDNWKTNGSTIAVEQGSNVPKKNGTASSETLLGDRNCALCSEHILPNDGMYTPSGFYHKQCLVCGNCKENLNIWKHINVEGVLYCYPKCNTTATAKSKKKYFS